MICELPCHAHAGLCNGWHLWLRFFLSFLHDEKSKIRRSQRTKESRPTSRAHRTRRPPLPHVGRARAPNPVGLWRSRTRHLLLSLPFLTAHFHPLPSSRAFPLSKGVPEGRGIKVPRSPMLLGFTPVVASRHREARSDPFMPDLCKICFK